MSLLETPARIEPLFFSDGMPEELAGLAKTIEKEAAALGDGLHAQARAQLSGFMGIVDSYHSNAIEGIHVAREHLHKAVEGAALGKNADPTVLQLRALADTCRAIDRLHREGGLPCPVSADFIRWLHRGLFERLPETARSMEGADGSRQVVGPGEFRHLPEHEVSVGAHSPPSPDRVPIFMQWFEKRLSGAGSRRSLQIVALAAAHHRFCYIHPFLDGNGRVARLMSRAMIMQAGVGGCGLWSLSRGLADQVEGHSQYKRMLDHADMPRQGDLDGRGNLSQAALRDFSEWFLETCLKQVRFSRLMFDLEHMEERYRELARSLIGGSRVADLMSAALRNGSVSGEIAHDSGLIEHGFLALSGEAGQAILAIPLNHASSLFPGFLKDDTTPWLINAPGSAV